MRRSQAEEIVGFEVSRKTFPNPIERFQVRRQITKEYKIQHREAISEYQALAEEMPLTYGDILDGNQRHQEWNDAKTVLLDRFQMRKELIGLNIARFILESPFMGSPEIRHQLTSERNKDYEQLMLTSN